VFILKSWSLSKLLRTKILYYLKSNIYLRGVIMPKMQKPGIKPDRPGEYIERGPRGGEVSDARQVTIKQGGKKLPPTQEQDRKWVRIGPPEK
jgi:hypothetical protein